jgi:hypothetical protein
MATFQFMFESVRRRTDSLQRRRRYCSIKRVTVLCFALLAYAAHLAPSRADDETERQKVREAMNKLAPLVGKWDAAVNFYDKDGLTQEDGTWSVSFVLDDRYLEIQSERHVKGDPTRRQKVTYYVTFSTKTNRYHTTYFFNRWSEQVTEAGEYDAATREFRTRGYIPLEDGINDETVNSVTSLKDPNRIVHRHYTMRSPAETCQRMDLEIILTHARQ